MKFSSSALAAVLAITTLAAPACAADYFTDFSSFLLGEMNGQQGWTATDPTNNAGAIMGIGGIWGPRSASLGYVSPLLNNSVYLSHAATTPLVNGGVNAGFSVLFQMQDSDSGYGDGSEARDTFGFRLENAAGVNLFSFFLKPFDQDPTPQIDTLFDIFSWSTGNGAPIPVLPGLSSQENHGYTFMIDFKPSGLNDVAFVADINGSLFTGVLTGMAGQTITRFGAFWIPLNGPSATGSNFLIFDNVSLASKPLGVVTQPYGDFTYISDGAAITLMSYTGTGGDVVIPATINGLPVTRLWNSLFSGVTGLTGITIPGSVVTIGSSAFAGCTGLVGVTIPYSVTNVANFAFSGCTGLTSVLFMGNLPGTGTDVFTQSNNVTVCYLPGATGWGAAYAARPAVPWNPVIQAGAPGFGMGPNGFGFDITGNANIPIVVEATTNTSLGGWIPLHAGILSTGLFHFNDPDAAQYPARFYRVRTP